MARPTDSVTTLPDLVLANPLAGAGRARRALEALLRFAKQRAWCVEFVVTTSPADLDRNTRAALSKGYPRIFILGGDGTFQVVANAIGPHTDIILGILPAGGGNDLAASLGLPDDALAAAQLLLTTGCPGFLDAVRVRTSDGAERLYTGGGGVGLDAEASRFAGENYRNVPGRMRYIFSVVRALFGFTPMRVRVRFAPRECPPIDTSALLVGVLNTPSYGAGLRLAPDAKTDDGELDLVLLKNLEFLEILRILPALIVQGTVRTKRLFRYRARCVRIETDRPCAYHGDGEILGMTPVEIEMVPRAFRILRPGKPA